MKIDTRTLISTVISIVWFIIPLCSQIPNNFEFLDHSERYAYLGASCVIGENVYYVSHQGGQTRTKLYVVNKDNEVETLWSFGPYSTLSKVLSQTDSSSVFVIYRPKDYDLFPTGFFVLNINDSGLKVDTILHDPERYNNSPFAGDVAIDSKGRYLLSDWDDILIVEGDSIIDRFPKEGINNLFLNSEDQIFGIRNRSLLQFSNSSHQTVHTFSSDIKDIIENDGRNYVLAESTIDVFNKDFSNKISSISIPANINSFDQVIFDDELKMITYSGGKFEIFKVDSEGLIISEHIGDAPTESFYKLIPLSKDNYFLMGAYEPRTFISQIFFRNYSIVEENIYDKVDITLESLVIDRLSSDTLSIYDTPDGGTQHIGYHEFKISLQLKNNDSKDVSLVSVIVSDKDENDVYYLFDLAFDSKLESNKTGSSTHYIRKFQDSKGFRDSSNASVFITGANFKFNSNPSSDIELTVDVDELIEDSSFTLYPNPTTDFLNLMTDRPLASISIYDLNGLLLYSNFNLSSTDKIDVSRLSAGTYFLRADIKNQDQYVLSKFIKI